MNLSKAFTRREKVLMTILAVLILAAFYFFAVHRPVVDALSRIEAETQTVDSEMIVLQAKAQHLADMKAELNALPENAPQTPTYDNLKQLMTFLNTVMAGTSDYEMSFQTQQPGENGNVMRRVVNMRFVCPSYASARQTLEDLRGCPYRCLASDLTITPYTGKNGRQEKNRPITTGPVQVGLTVTFFESVK